jgi:hypothetical protein
VTAFRMANPWTSLVEALRTLLHLTVHFTKNLLDMSVKH